MTTLFIRTILIYSAVFAVIRLMGKRQLSDMQPFDFVVTLLIADIVSEPISDPGIPLIYGLVPVMTLFILHKSVSFISLKSEAVRKAVCGAPVLIAAHGIVYEKALRAADLTLDDLTELLREKDIFTISEIEYCMLETNGSISVLSGKSGDAPMLPAAPLTLIVADGRLRKRRLEEVGVSKETLIHKLENKAGIGIKDCFFICCEEKGSLIVQEKVKSPGAEPKKHKLRI